MGQSEVVPQQELRHEVRKHGEFCLRSAWESGVEKGKGGLGEARKYSPKPHRYALCATAAVVLAVRLTGLAAAKEPPQVSGSLHAGGLPGVPFQWDSSF